jgi:hypothetical protein
VLLMLMHQRIRYQRTSARNCMLTRNRATTLTHSRALQSWYQSTFGACECNGDRKFSAGALDAAADQSDRARPLAALDRTNQSLQTRQDVVALVKHFVRKSVLVRSAVAVSIAWCS